MMDLLAPRARDARNRSRFDEAVRMPLSED
jgi:hypothetical protein